VNSDLRYWVAAGLLASILSGLYETSYYTEWLDLSLRLSDPFLDTALIFLALTAKTLFLELPIILFSVLLMSLGFPKLARAQFFLSNVVLFLWLHLDLICQDISGNHIFFYLPMVFTLNAVGGAELVGGTATLLLNVLPAFLVILGLAVVLRIGRAKLRECPLKLSVGTGLALLGLGLFSPIGLSERNLEWRLHDVIPVRSELVFTGLNHLESKLFPKDVMIAAVKPFPRAPRSAEVFLTNRTDNVIQLNGWVLHNRAGEELALEGELKAQETGSFSSRQFSLDDKKDELRLVRADATTEDRIQYSKKFIQQDRVLNFRPRHEKSPFLKGLIPQGQGVFSDLKQTLGAPQPADTTYRLPEGKRPNVVIFVIESLRQDAVSAEKTPKLHKFAELGLQLKSHWTSNSSHLGLFNILYGRVPITYQRDLLDRVPPQLPIIFREAGYEAQFYISAPFQEWLGMGLFVNEDFFHKVQGPKSKGGSPDIGWIKWPEKDIQTLTAVREYINGSPEKPLMAVCFLGSTHFPYAYPPEFATRQPDGHKTYSLANWSRLPEAQLRNRYANSVSFLDHEIAGFLEGIDLKETIVVITGDHGESFWEDGTLSHGNRASSVQCLVPCVIVGGGIEPRTIAGLTAHQDLLPTLLHAITGQSPELVGCHGQDILSGQPLRESTFIAPNCLSEPAELIFIYRGYRLLFELYSDKGIKNGYTRLYASGFLDEQGRMGAVSPKDDQVEGYLEKLKEAVHFLR
jgi:hypothetical protein